MRSGMDCAGKKEPAHPAWLIKGFQAIPAAQEESGRCASIEDQFSCVYLPGASTFMLP